MVNIQNSNRIKFMQSLIPLTASLGMLCGICWALTLSEACKLGDGCSIDTSDAIVTNFTTQYCQSPTVCNEFIIMFNRIDDEPCIYDHIEVDNEQINIKYYIDRYPIGAHAIVYDNNKNGKFNGNKRIPDESKCYILLQSQYKILNISNILKYIALGFLILTILNLFIIIIISCLDTFVYREISSKQDTILEINSDETETL